MLGVAEPAPSGPIRVALYIDADNQSPQTASALVDLLCAGLGARIVHTTIAGNSDGKVSAGWSAALREQIPALPINMIVVPCRKDAADAALILALGADLADHLRLGTRVVLVSRDALLLAAAERARAAGCRIYVAYSDSGSLTARDPGLTTFLLPALPASGAQAEKPPLVTIVPKVPAELSAPKAEVAKVIAQVRGMCKQQPGGGYSATDVGQALAKIGYKTPAERKRVIATFPGLRERGSHPHKLLVF
ncbi:NYN domain-containing protein [Thiocapsa roseopersicina]|uniref:NYN domain-containing protein n=2 Tax=Thiocapsa roseopersicina TaxID=1058 RepID=A0A1H2QWK6_THIRO|nr:NYN domain-containing protein [Thiocapsa roseopersicina]